jgi:hypothetical protein
MHAVVDGLGHVFFSARELPMSEILTDGSVILVHT